MPDWCALTQDDEDAVGAISMVTNAINEKKNRNFWQKNSRQGFRKHIMSMQGK